MITTSGLSGVRYVEQLFRTCDFKGNPERKIEEIFLKRIEPSKQHSLIPSGYVSGVYKRVSATSSKNPPWRYDRGWGRGRGGRDCRGISLLVIWIERALVIPWKRPGFGGFLRASYQG